MASLSSLAIGALSLSPAFSPSVTSYTAETSNATSKLSATAASTSATVTMAVDGAAVVQGASHSWKDGKNVVTVTVKQGNASKTYIVTVTKS